MADVLSAFPDGVAIQAVAEQIKLSQAKPTSAVNRLEDTGAISVRPGGEVALVAGAGGAREYVGEAVAAQERREALERSRLEMMRSHAELVDDSRREFVLNYFGDPYEGPCGNCDNCDAGRVPERSAADEPHAVGSRVAHPEWGGGVVYGYDDGRVTVLFDAVGYRSLGLSLVAERGLLEPEAA